MGVLTCSCVQRYTFEINGRDAVYLGSEDLHDGTYDHMAQSVNLQEYFNVQAKDDPLVSPCPPVAA